jgi:hypothetical protein
MSAGPWDRSPVGVQRTPPFRCHRQLVQPARPRLHRRPESWTGASLTPPGVVGHMLGQQAVDDVGGSRQLGYQGVPLIHDHSTMDARSLTAGAYARVESSPEVGQLHCRSSQGGDRSGAAGGDGCARSGRRGHRAARGVGARGVGGGLLRLLSVRTDGSLWHDLVEWRAWSDERYAAWLGRFWIAVLVKPTSLRFTGSTTPGVVPGLNRLARPVRPSSCQRAPSSASCHRACRCPVWSSPNRWPLARI